MSDLKSLLSLSLVSSSSLSLRRRSNYQEKAIGGTLFSPWVAVSRLRGPVLARDPQAIHARIAAEIFSLFLCGERFAHGYHSAYFLSPKMW